jgi:type VI secretion system secreted protein VgrG
MNIHTLLPGGLKVEFPDKTPESGPGCWVTIEHDYHGLKNTAIMALNRLTSMADEGRLFGSEGKDYQNTKRDKVQQWKPLPEEAEEAVKAQSVIHKYGVIRRLTQIYLEGSDAWAIKGSAWYWQPVTTDIVYEQKGDDK